VRVPRVLMGAAVGACLAISGAALQAMVRNMLADPYILGVSGGASTGAAAALLFGFGAALGDYAQSVLVVQFLFRGRGSASTGPSAPASPTSQEPR